MGTGPVLERLVMVGSKDVFFSELVRDMRYFFIEMVIVSYYHYDYFSLLGFCFIASSTVRLY